MAFTLEEYTSKEAKIDPRYVKWLATYIRYEDSVVVEKRSEPLHPCTDEDFSKFDAPERRSVDRATKYREQGGLFCIDWEKANFLLFGAPSDADHSVIDVMAIPCNMRDTVLQAAEDRSRDDCDWDRDAAIDYIGDINVVTYYNQGRFMPDEFEDDPVLRYSIVHEMRADQSRPNWFKTYVENAEVSDET
mmetsp:Transcript_42764/g.56462  ORF Transcript_42764/g.56462 Transcript_42764/m.56462 type:complete len:190 (-) Transcript_42764:1262-1831(-)|eukprot:CAMPEP_0185570716 /NCGR_PEP_ID=MMETSP0434-20130131/2932_1 /TAXON_ID=626734 ORGANISM="Favella taraikaensis, Strain Fe Narragansett Bay" /NCGR_SAMPLE_ID=MMETSP0434 /ASSEMBLY_ACC=CAM_ASM_000379 /LENGTH=189 /DNA_ID=CAMNT_0028185917 /DNA_START=213 /DNA_END=782 /DNA_ORIENTATION=-